MIWFSFAIASFVGAASLAGPDDSAPESIPNPLLEVLRTSVVGDAGAESSLGSSRAGVGFGGSLGADEGTAGDRGCWCMVDVYAAVSQSWMKQGQISKAHPTQRMAEYGVINTGICLLSGVQRDSDGPDKEGHANKSVEERPRWSTKTPGVGSRVS